MADIKQLLQEKDFRFNKQFGQNFLTDQNLLQEICDDAKIDGGVVLEVGSGAGTLTRVLSKNANKVITFEIDKHLKEILDTTLADCNNVQVIIGDIMRYEMHEIEALCGGEFSLVANIPYYITTPLLMNFVENSQNVTSLTLTIQKEVADRLSAKPSTKDYGAITVGVCAFADVEVTRVLSRTLFYPQPNVDSAVVHIEMNRNKFDIIDRKLFRKVVKSSFAMRRKTLVNNLMVGFGLDRAEAEQIIIKSELPVGCRGEELSVEQYVKLFETIKNLSF